WEILGKSSQSSPQIAHVVIPALVQLERRRHFLDQFGNSNWFDLSAAELLIKMGHCPEVCILDDFFGVRVFARGNVEANFQWLQVRGSRQINATISPTEFESLHLAVSQFGGRSIGARLGLSLGAAPFTNPFAAEGVFDDPRFVPVT